jgi:cytochrome c oxidase subunit 2
VCSAVDIGPTARPETGPRRHLRRFTKGRGKLAAALLIPLLAAGCQLPSFGLFRGATTQGHDTFKLWQLFVVASIVVGGIVLILILWAAFRYRQRKSAASEGLPLPKQFQYHLPLEILYTVLPIVIVLVLFGFTVATENNVDATPPNPAVTVNVTAFQWGWRFAYSGTHVVVEGHQLEEPEMVLPVDKRVRIQLRSADVVHGFYVPEFVFSRYAQPGVLNKFDFNVTHPGVYKGQCTQLCGLYHAEMIFKVKAVSGAQYQRWLGSTARIERLTGRPIT